MLGTPPAFILSQDQTLRLKITEQLNCSKKFLYEGPPALAGGAFHCSLLLSRSGCLSVSGSQGSAGQRRLALSRALCVSASRKEVIYSRPGSGSRGDSILHNPHTTLARGSPRSAEGRRKASPAAGARLPGPVPHPKAEGGRRRARTPSRGSGPPPPPPDENGGRPPDSRQMLCR